MSSSSVFPLEIQELRRPGAVYRMDVKCFTSIKDIKDQLHKELKCPPSRMQLYHSVGSKRLANQSTLHDLGITQAGGVLYLSVLFSTNPQFMLLPAKDMCVDEYCEEMIGEVRLGLRSGHLPAKTDMLDCTGGVYFLKGGANTPVAVFKPSDEEQGMPNNPKGHAGNGDYGLRPYFRPGEGYLRETASYILDHGGFCGVPPTVIVHCEHDSFNYPFSQTGKKTMFPKLGSLQRFVPSSDTFEDIGHSLVGVLELQKIALLDMRLLNCDRNASNMLAIRKTQSARSARGYGRDAVPRKYSRSSSLGTASECYEEEREEISMDEFLDSEYQPSLHGHASRYSDQYALVPIDHGYCLPSHLQIDELDWAWFHCPHVAVEVQPEIREYINSLDIEALLEDLTSQVPVSEDCLYLLRVAHAVVKEGINAGLTLRDIAALIARTEEDVPSPLENAIAAAEDNAQRAMESRAGRRGTANSPSFAKAMLSCSAEGAAVNLNLLLPPRGHTNSMRVREVGSPEPVVIVKQRSVGSPRCAGAASPPQRIGAMKRVTPPSPSASPSDGSESDGCSLCSGADCAHMGKGGSSGPSSAKKNRGGSVIGSHQRVMPEDSRLSIALPDGGVPPALGAGAGTPLVRPFPLRGTPDRPRRVVSSELNLECLNRGSPPSVTAPPSLESGYSLSCDSRSPGPPRQEPFCSMGSRIRQQSGERVSIAYLSSENIQRLQGSPAVTASKFGDFLTKDTPTASSRARPESARGDQSPSCAGAGGEQSLGDYFMKDLTAPASTPGPTGPWSLRMELPPMGLVSSSSAAASPLCSRSPSSAFNAHQAGSKERITASVSTEKLSTGAAAAGSGLPRSVSSAQSLGSTGSASSRGEGNKRNGGLQGIGAAVRPKAGDALFKLQSFDDGSLLRQLHRAGPASAPNPLLSPSPPSLRPSAAVLPTACGAGSAEVATHAQLSQSQLPAMSSSLFASDSDFTSHSTGTSYESSWASESPKMSPKVSDKSRRSLAGDQVVGVVLQGLVERVEVPVRDDVRYSSRRAAELGGDIAAGSMCDGPVLFSMPLKGDESCGQSPARAVCSPDSADRECTSSVELGGTDTEGDFDEVLPLPPRGQGIVHSATKPKPSLSAQRGAAQPGTEPASPGASLAGLSMPMKLARVASFAAFESPPLYDLPKAERQLTRLRQERRKANAKTAEFQQLRLHFTKEMVSAVVAKTARVKAAT